MALKFSKMHGLGNDFIFIDSFHQPLPALQPEIARQLCNRRTGIGADQILILNQASRPYHAEMLVWNADGTTAEMCGNGIRAAGLYLQNHIVPGRRFLFKTLAGDIEVHVESADKIKVNMGAPKEVESGKKLKLQTNIIEYTQVDVGNPHAVIFTDNIEKILLEKLGPEIECHPDFPHKTNVEWVQVLLPNHIQVRVWERGAGTTLACGTGACASAAAAIKTGKAKSPLRVQLPGGSLTLSWDGKSDTSLWMEGPAVEVYRGEVSYPLVKVD